MHQATLPPRCCHGPVAGECYLMATPPAISPPHCGRFTVVCVCVCVCVLQRNFAVKKDFFLLLLFNYAHAQGELCIYN